MSGAYLDWPFRCPASWRENPVKPLIRSEIEDGYPKQRRRFTKIWYQYQADFRLSWDDHGAFWQFYELDCQGGAIPFKIKHPISDKELLVRFMEPPQVNGSVEIKPFFDVSLKLELQFS
jgi:hypothetical protein